MTERRANSKQSSNTMIEGGAAAIRIDNLDTDQIMPKQFLHGIDKAGLAQGVLYDLRFDAQGKARPDFVLNRTAYAQTSVLVAGANFGCGSSREHAVWGLQQYGIHAVIASSFGEIFYSNAMNNRLMLVMLPEDQVHAFMPDADRQGTVRIDIHAMRVKSDSVDAPFTLSERHQRMFLDGLDIIGMSLTYKSQIAAFSEAHWAQQPWVRDVAKRTRQRLEQESGA